MEKIKSIIGTRIFNIVFAGTLALATLGSWISLFFIICMIVAWSDKGK